MPFWAEIYGQFHYFLINVGSTYVCVVKTKSLIITAQLILAFVFAYATCWLSDVLAYLL